MAGQVKISIKDRNTANSWIQTVNEINEAYNKAMDDAGNTLVDMQNFADGALVDDFVALGTDLLNAAQATFTEISKIADAVNTILNTVENFVDSAKDVIKNTVSNIFGR